MTTNYDPIAEQYQRSKQQPWRTFVEAHSLFQHIGDPAGLHVLDVACGEGFYTRMLKQRGAARVLGVDLSPGMIELAQRQEAQYGLGIEYQVRDALDLQLDGQFDLVVAAYLLNYARNRAELTAMCRGIAQALKPGGRFVTVNCSPWLDFAAAPSFRPYGFETTLPHGPGEGAPITWTFHLADGPFSIENYFLDPTIHDDAFRAAGFCETRWHRPQLAPQGREQFGADHWAPFMEQPPITLIECIRA